MKKMILPILMAGLFAVSCSKKETTTETTETEQVAEEKVAFSGTFEGTLPCADCSGIETKLTLNEEDKTFVLETKYLGKEQDNEFKEEGNFEISEDQKCVILKDDSTPTPQVFHITQEAAYQVESETHTELKEDYKLSRK